MHELAFGQTAPRHQLHYGRCRGSGQSPQASHQPRSDPGIVRSAGVLLMGNPSPYSAGRAGESDGLAAVRRPWLAKRALAGRAVSVP